MISQTCLDLGGFQQQHSPNRLSGLIKIQKRTSEPLQKVAGEMGQVCLKGQGGLRGESWQCVFYWNHSKGLNIHCVFWSSLGNAMQIFVMLCCLGNGDKNKPAYVAHIMQ